MTPQAMGFGDWWVSTTNGFVRWVPEPLPVHDAFWPAFVLTVALGWGLVFLLERRCAARGGRVGSRK